MWFFFFRNQFTSFKIITDLLCNAEIANTLLPKPCTKKASRVAHSKINQENHEKKLSSPDPRGRVV